jgi:hypothetical protein
MIRFYAEWMQFLRSNPDPLTTYFEHYPLPPPHGWSMQDYRRSDLWGLVIRPRVLRRDAYECWRCAHGGLDVHHVSYHPFVLAGLADEWLFTVCRSCHRYIHEGATNLDQWRRLNYQFTKRGFPRLKMRVRMKIGHTLPSKKQISQWRRQTARGEIMALRKAMRLLLAERGMLLPEDRLLIDRGGRIDHRIASH